jgi:hypothetical protein
VETQTLKLSVDEFLVGPQELVLLHRHGAGERGRPGVAMGGDIRRAIKEALRSREIYCRVRFQVRNAVIELTSEDLYEHEGRICKIVFLSRQQAEDRKKKPATRELESLKFAGWVAEHYFATPPQGLRLYYHVFGKGAADAEIEGSWYREFPLASEDEIQPLIAERTRRIVDALTQPDEALPECTLIERDGTLGTPYSKCRDWCPTRQHCQQIKRHYNEATERSLSNQRILEGIVINPPVPSPHEEDAKRRKERIAGMMMAGNFFEEDFPREQFRLLLKAQAEAEQDDLENKTALLEMATVWSNAKFVQWRAWLDRQD